MPTICKTPVVTTKGCRLDSPNLQNRYPGNSGSSTCVTRSDHCRTLVYRGKKHSKPLAWSSVATADSFLARTCSAYQCSTDERLVADDVIDFKIERRGASPSYRQNSNSTPAACGAHYRNSPATQKTSRG